MEINIYDSRVFNTGIYRFIPDPLNLLLDSIAVMLGDYRIERKMAANIILKMMLRNDFRKQLFEDKKIYPYKRSDYRVNKWKKEVLSKGKCEICGKTENLEAHHILHWADYPMGRIDVNNGMCLCHDCHTEEHKNDQSYHMMKAKCG